MKKNLSYKDYFEGTRKILRKSKKEKAPYRTSVCSREFVVLPNVFSPKYFHDSEIFAKHLPVKAGEKMLEIGSGTGVISITAIYKGAKRVIAIDINKNAVENTRQNIALHKMEAKIEILEGDVYSSLKLNEKFDTIFWNIPFGFVKEKNLSDLEKAVYDSDYQSTQKFIQEAPKHLKKDGRLLIGFSTTLGREDLLRKFAIQAGFELKLIFEQESQETHLVKFQIFEAKIK